MVQGEEDEDEELLPGGVQPEEMPDEEDPSQAEVLMTQASKRRSMMEQPRGYTRNESKEQAGSSDSEMKSRMCCSARKAHGVTSFGHWRNDLQCPFHPQTTAKKKPEGKGVFVVTQDDGTFSDSSWQISQNDFETDRITLAMSDAACCAKTVAGSRWMEWFMKYLESQESRFGPGPQNESTYAAVIPTTLGGSGQKVHLLVSVVPTNVPLLMRRSALQSVGAVLDLPRSLVEFKNVDSQQHLQLARTYAWGSGPVHRRSKPYGSSWMARLVRFA